MKAYLITETEAKTVEIENNLDVYYNLLECRCFDIACRKVGDTYFDIFCDDEGLFKDNPLVTAVRMTESGSLEQMLVGNLLFTHTDSDGNTVGITDADVNTIEDNLFFMLHGNFHMTPVVMMEY